MLYLLCELFFLLCHIGMNCKLDPVYYSPWLNWPWNEPIGSKRWAGTNWYPYSVYEASVWFIVLCLWQVWMSAGLSMVFMVDLQGTEALAWFCIVLGIVEFPPRAVCRIGKLVDLWYGMVIAFLWHMKVQVGCVNWIHLPHIVYWTKPPSDWFNTMYTLPIEHSSCYIGHDKMVTNVQGRRCGTWCYVSMLYVRTLLKWLPFGEYDPSLCV
jgi:hypothetical protein